MQGEVVMLAEALKEEETIQQVVGVEEVPERLPKRNIKKLLQRLRKNMKKNLPKFERKMLKHRQKQKSNKQRLPLNWQNNKKKPINNLQVLMI